MKLYERKVLYPWFYRDEAMQFLVETSLDGVD